MNGVISEKILVKILTSCEMATLISYSSLVDVIRIGFTVYATLVLRDLRDLDYGHATQILMVY
jgi:ribosomal protein S25